MNPDKPYYCSISTDFLYKTTVPEFKIFSKTSADEENFALVATYTSKTHQKILEMMNLDLEKKYYINEATLIQYYIERIKKLKHNLVKMNLSPIDQIKTLHQLATEIMQEFFEKGASAKILRVQDDLVDMIEPCFSSNAIPFVEIFKITSKHNLLHTHSANVGLYSLALGTTFKLNQFERRELFLGALFSDVGKKTIPDAVKFKKGVVTPEEFREIRKHPAASRKILSDLRSYSENILRMAAEHHEKFNGTGYPMGLSGEKISLSTKICSLMDVFSALTSDRCHRPQYSPIQALGIMKNEMAGSFDDRVFAGFVRALTPATASV